MKRSAADAAPDTTTAASASSRAGVVNPLTAVDKDIAIDPPLDMRLEEPHCAPVDTGTGLTS
jgi:hypothetical protein